MADRRERRGVVISALRKEAFVGQPIRKAETFERLEQIGLQAGKPNSDSVHQGLLEKEFEMFEADDVGIANALEAQDYVANAFVMRLPFDPRERAVKFRCRSEEQFTFKVVQQEPRVRRIGWKPAAHLNDPLILSGRTSH